MPPSREEPLDEGMPLRDSDEPMSRGDEARQEYLSLRLAIDDFARDVRRTHGDQIQCGRGCYACCVAPKSTRWVEAERLRKAVRALPTETRERIKKRANDQTRLLCPLLEDGACLVYEDRPIACRAKGMPLAVERDDGTYQLDYCRLNFTTVPRDFELRRRHILNVDGTGEILDAINRRVVEHEGLDADDYAQVSFRHAALGRLVPASPAADPVMRGR